MSYIHDRAKWYEMFDSIPYWEKRKGQDFSYSKSILFLCITRVLKRNQVLNSWKRRTKGRFFNRPSTVSKKSIKLLSLNKKWFTLVYNKIWIVPSYFCVRVMFLQFKKGIKWSAVSCSENRLLFYTKYNIY